MGVHSIHVQGAQAQALCEGRIGSHLWYCWSRPFPLQLQCLLPKAGHDVHSRALERRRIRIEAELRLRGSYMCIRIAAFLDCSRRLRLASFS